MLLRPAGSLRRVPDSREGGPAIVIPRERRPRLIATRHMVAAPEHAMHSGRGLMMLCPTHCVIARPDPLYDPLYSILYWMAIADNRSEVGAKLCTQLGRSGLPRLGKIS